MRKLKRNFLIALIILNAVFFAASLYLYPRIPKQIEISEISLAEVIDGDIIIGKINNSEIKLEAAESESAKQQGLMFRENLKDNEGMIFLYDDLMFRTFWMQNTPSSLDIIFLDSDMEVINIHKNTKPNQINERYSSEEPSQFVIETRAGWSEKNSLKKGDKFSLRVIEE